MDAAYLDHLAARGVDPRAELEDADDWLGEPLTDADGAAIWRSIGTPEEPPYGDFPPPGDARRTEVQSDADAVDSAVRDRAGDLAAEAKAATRAPSKSHSAGDSHTDKPEQQADEETTKESDDDSNSATDDRGVSELTQDADATPTHAAEVEPVAATGTTACAIAVTRAHCAIDRAHQQLDTIEQQAAAERDDELTRWHADDTTAQQAANDTAAHDSAAVHGGE
ncbi:hypothetical protein [Kribbella sp. NPDC023855]|uniref:hypothetical protein n=1 Tax=Kribbella sp. NPDC023855 TaxID=3154698 RepID=UPI0033C653C1